MLKAGRILSLYDRLIQGKMLIKAEEAMRFQVDTRTIQRDLDDIRAHLVEGAFALQLVYDRKKAGYEIRKIIK